MGAAVAPAVGTAFGSSAVASFVAPAVLTPIAATGASMMMNPAIMSAGGGGLFGGLSSMFSSLNSPLGGLLGDVSIMDLGFGASKVLSGVQSIRQGNIMKSQYELQALQTLTEMERQQFNATVEGAARLDKLQRIQSANLVKNYARGVGGLSGSALLNQIVSDQEYGKDYKMELYNIANIGWE